MIEGSIRRRPRQSNYCASSPKKVPVRDGGPCRLVTKDLPRSCKTCGTLCGSFMSVDGYCPLFGKTWCVLRADVRFRGLVSENVEGATA